MNTKPRVIKDFEKLDTAIQEQIKVVYPYGFSENLISFTDPKGRLVTALPFETDEKYYMIRMSQEEAVQLIINDDDYDDEGNLKPDAKDEYAEKYSELDYVTDNIPDEDEDEQDDED